MVCRSSESPSEALTTRPLPSAKFCLDDEAIQAWYESAMPSSCGKPQRYSDLTTTTVLVIKRVFRLNLRAVQGFNDSIDGCSTTESRLQ